MSRVLWRFFFLIAIRHRCIIHRLMIMMMTRRLGENCGFLGFLLQLLVASAAH